MSDYGYSHGQPFGDPEGFTRSTGEDEIDRFNQWMRAQPFWESIKGNSPGFNDQQQSRLVQTLAQRGIHVPGSFHIDEAGNFNQKGRGKKVALIAGIAGGVAASLFGVPGLFPGVLSGGSAATPAAALDLGPALDGGASFGGAAAGAGAGAAGAGAGAALDLGPALDGGASFGGGAGAAAGLPYIPPGAAAPADAAAASGAPAWQSIAKLAGAAGVPLLATHHGNTGTSGTGFSNQQTTEYINQLLQMATQRAHEAAPVHQAAMQLAMSMQPNWSNPRIADANSAAMTPPAPRTMDPQVAEAYARLMGTR